MFVILLIRAETNLTNQKSWISVQSFSSYKWCNRLCFIYITNTYNSRTAGPIFMIFVLSDLSAPGEYIYRWVFSTNAPISFLVLLSVKTSPKVCWWTLFNDQCWTVFWHATFDSKGVSYLLCCQLSILVS